MFIAALFTTAKTWKQPKCPSTEEWIKKMWYIYTMEYYVETKRMKSFDEDVEKLEVLCGAVGSVKWCNRCGKQYGNSSEN